MRKKYLKIQWTMVEKMLIHYLWERYNNTIYEAFNLLQRNATCIENNFDGW